MKIQTISISLLILLMASPIGCRAGAPEKTHDAEHAETITSETENSDMSAEDELKSLARYFITSMTKEGSSDVSSLYNRDFLEATIAYCREITTYSDPCDCEDPDENCQTEERAMTPEEIKTWISEADSEIVDEFLSFSQFEPLTNDVTCSWQAAFLPCEEVIPAICPNLDKQGYTELSEKFEIKNCGAIRFDCQAAVSENSSRGYSGTVIVGDVGEGIQGLNGLISMDLEDEIFKNASPLFSEQSNKEARVEEISQMECNAQEMYDVKLHDIAYELGANFAVHSNIEQLKGKTKEEIVEETKSRKNNWMPISPDDTESCSLKESYVDCDIAFEMHSYFLEDVEAKDILSEFELSECWVQTARITNKNKNDKALKYIDVEIIRSQVNGEWLVTSKCL